MWSWYDLAVAAILLFCLIRGLSKGFVWQLAAIGSVVLCFAFAETFSLALAPYLNVNPPLNRWVSMLLLYLACSFVCFALARALRSTLEKRQFQDYDRHLGGLFGLLKGAGVAVVVTFFAVTLSDKLRPTVLTSHSGHAAAVVMHALAPVFPDGLDRYIEPYLDNYEGLDEDPTGPRLADGVADPGDHLFGDGDGPLGGDGGIDGDGELAGGEGAFGGFGWGDDPAAEPVARGAGSSGDRPGPAPPGGRGDAPADGGFGTDPGGRGWFEEDGELNADRLAGEAARFGRGVLDDIPEDTRETFGRELADGARRRLGDEIDRRVGDLFGDESFGDEGFGDGSDPGGANAAAGRPAAAPPPSRSELLDRISRRYAADPATRDLFRRRAEGMLRGVPEGVVGAVLRDWLHDLRGSADGPDPNPETTIQTLLPDRIARGLAARVATPGTGRGPR